MPQFYIDVHADNLSKWDDDGHSLMGPGDAVSLAGDLAFSAVQDAERSGLKRHASAVIRNNAGEHVATVTVGAFGSTSVVWARPTDGRF